MLFLNLVCKAQDWDSTTYAQFRQDFMNIEVNSYLTIYPSLDEMKINFNNPTVKPALILMTTFMINHFIINHDEKREDFSNTTKKTGTIFLIGGTLTTLTFALEIKKQKRIRKIKCLTIN